MFSLYICYMTSLDTKFRYWNTEQQFLLRQYILSSTGTQEEDLTAGLKLMESRHTQNPGRTPAGTTRVLVRTPYGICTILVENSRQWLFLKE